jgi:hypothetical protein
VAAAAAARGAAEGRAAVTAALLALALAALPQGAARYRAELSGIPVGAAELAISCRDRCAVRFDARLRAPAESGGGLSEAAVEVEVDRAGRYRGGPLRVGRAGERAAPAGIADAVPASVLEVVLAAESGPGGRCIPFFDEERPEPREACARVEAGAVVADVNGVAVRIVPGRDGFPEEVLVAGRFRYVRDGAAEVPLDPPRLAGTRVPGPVEPRRARTFCGVALDPAPDPRGAGALPPPRAEGESCREKTAAWLAAARSVGLEGRTAVGVAWDGAAFVWHAWAEVRRGGAWIPVDPSFGQAPARGPRFTVARHAPGDPASRDVAGARILECWGTAVVE